MTTVRELLEYVEQVDEARLQQVADLIAQRYTNYVYEKIFGKSLENGLRMRECAGLILDRYIASDVYKLACELNVHNPPVTLGEYADFDVKIVYSVSQFAAQNLVDHADKRYCPITLVELVTLDMIHYGPLEEQVREIRDCYREWLSKNGKDLSQGEASVLDLVRPAL